MFHREKKGNTYATLTHFPGFLQNQSSYCSPSSSGYCGHAVSHRKIRHVFKPWGSNLSQLFRVQFKGVTLELLAPICKRGKKSNQCPLSTVGIPPCSRWGWRQVFHLTFLPWPELTCLLPQVFHYCPSPFYHWGGVEMHQGYT